MPNRFELPEPPPDALVHSARVADFIRQRIRAAGGWIDFAEYMELALYAPGIGYYSAGSAKLGPAGDFVTAPEISPLFARCMARACAPWLEGGDCRVILELGAGTGALAAEVLTSLARLGTPPDRYLILEVSADLRERQRATLSRLAPGHLAGVEWLDRLPATPMRGVVLANEVADALPVSRFTVRDGRVVAVGVAESRAGFGWVAREPTAALSSAVAGIEKRIGAPLPEGYSSEVCLRLPAWVGAVAAALRSGLFLLGDYGMSRHEYYQAERSEGTLICHYRHRAHDEVFLYPGLQDITAWVDFTTVAESATAAGLAVAGYATQAHFLIDAGLEAELGRMTRSSRPADLRAIQQAKTLLLPGEMGEKFKLMALTRGDQGVRGFGFRDLRHLL